METKNAGERNFELANALKVIFIKLLWPPEIELLLSLHTEMQ